MPGIQSERQGFVAPRPPGAGGALSWTAVFALYVLDAYVLGYGFIAAGLLALSMVVLLPKAAVLHRLGRPWWSTLQRVAILMACASAIMVTIDFNARLARARGDELARAIEQFQAVAGHYPDSLEQLVPAYVAQIPVAKYRIGFNRFSYRRAAAGIEFGYSDTPPFGWLHYDFVARRWSDESALP